MDIDEIHVRISEMGKSAGHGFEENAKIIYSLLVTLNGSGLIASLAFIGTILGAKLEIAYMPFYWCVILFGIGITTSFISLLSNFLYFRMAVSKYHESYLNVDPAKLTGIDGLLPVLTTLATATKGQRICSNLQKYLPVISIIAFALGLIAAVFYLYALNLNFQLLLSR
jgi:hypothetical protein